MQKKNNQNNESKTLSKIEKMSSTKVVILSEWKWKNGRRQNAYFKQKFKESE